MSTKQEGDLLGLGQPYAQSATNLTLNLSSNNPFRNRAVSPSSISPQPRSPFDDPSPRPVSRNNPFLDPSKNNSAPRLPSPDKMASSVSAHETRSPTASEIFDKLTIDDNGVQKQAAPRLSAGGPMNRPPGAPRGENVAPQGRGPPPNHRPSRSQEEALRARRAPGASNGGLNAPGSPQKRMDPRRPRRNSESSLAEKPPMTDEEKKTRELRRKERERRHREGKDRAKPGRKIDIIDQLDATSIYGTGLFHHDGPFDACNPHRNRKGSRRAPMQAFAKDSANNSIGGSGPINKRPDHAQFMGQEPHEASAMYATTTKDKEPTKPELAFFDPKKRGDMEHGEQTLGLGSSTFLEGTPAAQTAIQRNQAEIAQNTMEAELGRKKSVVQRFRSIKRPQREYGDGRVTSPEARYFGVKSSDLPTGNSANERNPFFNEFDNGEEKISVRRKDSNPISPASPSGRMPALERRVTAGPTMESPEGQPKQTGNGFLSRVRSLKGGPRRRPEPPSKDVVGATSGTAI